jgi:hypothetical protein
MMLAGSPVKLLLPQAANGCDVLIRAESGGYACPELSRLGSRALEFETFSVPSECHTYGAPPDFLWTLMALANFMWIPY